MKLPLKFSPFPTLFYLTPTTGLEEMFFIKVISFLPYHHDSRSPWSYFRKTQTRRKSHPIPFLTIGLRFSFRAFAFLLPEIAPLFRLFFSNKKEADYLKPAS